MSRMHDPVEKDGKKVWPEFENPLLPGKVPENYEDDKMINS